MKALFRNELVPFPVEPDPAGGYRMRLFVHLLPEADRASVLADLLPESLTLGTTHHIGEDLGARAPSPVDSADFRVLQRVVEEHYPGTVVGPYFLPWTATDSRFYRAAGIPSYGFSPFLIAVTDTMGDRARQRAHADAGVRPGGGDLSPGGEGVGRVTLFAANG